MKKKILGLLLTAAMVMSLLMTGCGASNGADTSAEDSASSESDAMPEKIRLGYFQVPNDEMTAITESLYDTIPCEVELVEFNSGKDVNNALASGSVDLGYMGTVPAASGLASGLDYEICWIHAILGEIESLVVKDGAGVSQVADLKGKSIGVVIGSTSHYSLLKALEDAGLSESDVTIINGDTSEINAMWTRGDIDAAYIWDPTLTALKEAGGTVIFTGEDGAAIGATTGTVEVVNKDFGAKYPQAVAYYLLALQNAHDYYSENHDKVITDIASRLEISEELATSQMDGSLWLSMDEQMSSDYLGTSDSIGAFADIIKDTQDFLEAQSSISAAQSLDDIKSSINPSYLELAKELSESE